MTTKPTSYQLGNRAFVSKDYVTAVEHFIKHCEDFPEDTAKCHTKIAECCLRSNALSKPQKVHPCATLVFEGNKKGAKKHYRLALEADPNYYSALYGLARLLPDKSPERFELLKTAVAAQETPLAMMDLADYYRSVLKQHDKAYDLYLRMQKRWPKDQLAYMRLNDICRRMGKSNEAKQWSAKWAEAKQ